jgi:hypothetical protein
MRFYRTFNLFTSVPNNDSNRTLGRNLADSVQNMKQKGLTPCFVQNFRKGRAHALSHPSCQHHNPPGRTRISHNLYGVTGFLQFGQSRPSRESEGRPIRFLKESETGCVKLFQLTDLRSSYKYIEVAKNGDTMKEGEDNHGRKEIS